MPAYLSSSRFCTNGDCCRPAGAQLLEGVAANGGYDAGGWGDYANAVAGKVGAVLFAGCVAGVEGEGKDVETGMYAETSTRTERQNIEH